MAPEKQARKLKKDGSERLKASDGGSQAADRTKKMKGFERLSRRYGDALRELAK